MTSPLFLLAHGAGAGQSHPFMQRWAERLGALGHVVPFEYRYMASGRKPPDRLPALLERHREALIAAREGRERAPIVLIGKSMGSRVGCHLANDPEPGGPIRALVCLGYPLQGGSKLRDAVLLALRTPVLFVQGTRDPLCPLPLLEGVRSRMSAPTALHVVQGGDHSLEVGKRALAAAGTTQSAVDDEAFEAVRAFVTGLVR